jgi:GTP cyclohydrolase II
LRSHGIDVRTVLPTQVHASDSNVRYLQAKVAHTAHTIDLAPAVEFPVAAQ